eukprot:6989764-Alexandrium_andersonii.AAC.1
MSVGGVFVELIPWLSIHSRRRERASARVRAGRNPSEGRSSKVGRIEEDKHAGKVGTTRFKSVLHASETLAEA